MKNLVVPRNHISQLIDMSMATWPLFYSGGLAIEPLREGIHKLTYGPEIDFLTKKMVLYFKKIFIKNVIQFLNFLKPT